ncbi:MAG: hypothetical protein HC938_14500 [Nitrospira sp.]|nr:hypothetical protein [Nitrospira sp.]
MEHLHRLIQMAKDPPKPQLPRTHIFQQSIREAMRKESVKLVEARPDTPHGGKPESEVEEVLADVQSGPDKFAAFKRAFRLFWPKHQDHAWQDKILAGWLNHDVLVVLGPSDAGKTFTMSKISLVDYWAHADNTLWLISTTEGRGSELRVWGQIKDLFNDAKRQYPLLAGKPLDYMKTITTSEVDVNRELARSLRRGLMVVPCKSGGIGSQLSAFAGVKAERLRHFGDEVQFMTEGFLSAYSNWYGKESFKGCMAGNFLADDDPLGIASEPEKGWDTYGDEECDQEWRGKFYDANVLSLDGRSSPNFDPAYYVPGQPPRFPWLIGEKKFKAVRKTHGEDSWQWHSQVLGKPVKNSSWNRIITRAMCEANHASKDVIWSNTYPLVRVFGLDPAYGGGDRCAAGMAQFGMDLSGRMILSFSEPEIVPIKPNLDVEPEDQIAAWIKKRLEALNIPPQNCFYDSFGRGTLGNAFAKVFGSICPVPVDTGSRPTDRPVRFDLFITDTNGQRRLKRCDEHYSKRVTELWFQLREAIQSSQIRNLSHEVILEASKRTHSPTRTGLEEAESKKDMIERAGCSPDLADMTTIALEAARSRGFRIERADKAAPAPPTPRKDWLDEQIALEEELNLSRQLVRV